MPATRWALGVDLGTTFCAGAVWRDGRAEVLEVTGELRTPSTVMWHDGELLAGRIADRLSARNPGAVERNPKRKVGMAPMLLDGHPVSASDALAALLQLFVDEGQRRFDGAPPVAAALTHPAGWSQHQCDILHAMAARVLPFTATSLVPEPVGAAAHYVGENTTPEGAQLAVYDLGGGTFDAAVVRVGDPAFHVVGDPGGDDDIGGEEFDRLVYDHFSHQLARVAPDWIQRISTVEDQQAHRDRDELLRIAREAKEDLSERSETAQFVRAAGTDVQLSRAAYESMIGPQLHRSLDTLETTLRSAGIVRDPRVAIFLTGASSRTPLVRQMLNARFGPVIRTWGDPKLSVAIGAARLAGQHGALPASSTTGSVPPTTPPPTPPVPPRVPAPPPAPPTHAPPTHAPSPPTHAPSPPTRVPSPPPVAAAMSPARGGKAPPSTRWLVFVSALLIGTVVCLISLIIGILAWRQARTDLAAARRLTKAGWIVIGCGIVIIALSGIASGA